MSAAVRMDRMDRMDGRSAGWVERYIVDPWDEGAVPYL